MKLLLDEMFSHRIARQLRSRDHDVVSVLERPELISKADREVFAAAAAERRAVVTNNVPDYTKLFSELAAAAEDHSGLLLTDDRSMPRTRKTVGLFVRALDKVLRDNPSEGALRNQVRWLP